MLLSFGNLILRILHILTQLHHGGYGFSKIQNLESFEIAKHFQVRFSTLHEICEQFIGLCSVAHFYCQQSSIIIQMILGLRIRIQDDFCTTIVFIQKGFS
ncbi:hypothetical protein DSECCO2_656380 [anaerobic digester metagenome]